MEASDIRPGQIWEIKTNCVGLPKTILILDEDILGSTNKMVPGFDHIHLVSILNYEFGSLIILDDKLTTIRADTILQLYELKQDASPPPIPEEDEEANERMAKINAIRLGLKRWTE